MQDRISCEELRQRVIYNPNTGEFTWRIDRGKKYKAGDRAGSAHSKGYVTVRLDNRLYFAHRLAWLYMTGNWPSMIDHVNQCRSDNRWNNLREVTPEQNQSNRNVRGIHRHTQTGRWVAQISVRGKTIHLGCFDDEETAMTIRKLAEQTRDEFYAR